MSDAQKPDETRPADSAPTPLPPGRGSPIVPGAPMSVGPPIPARTFNLAALLWVVAAGVLAILAVILVIALIHH
jgi:hypothetical protein